MIVVWVVESRREEEGNEKRRWERGRGEGEGKGGENGKGRGKGEGKGDSQVHPCMPSSFAPAPNILVRYNLMRPSSLCIQRRD